MRRKVFSTRKKLSLVIPSARAIIKFGSINPMRIGIIARKTHKLSCNLYPAANFSSTARGGKLIGIVYSYDPIVKQQIHKL